VSELWAITSYFNPAKYGRRFSAYKNFREALSIPLLTVEHGNAGELELTEGDADILVQKTGGDTMWQKERLLNLALDTLPESCDAVAWLDCDILFPDDLWIARLESALESVSLIQLFSQVNYLDPDWVPGDDMERHVERRRPSIASGVSSGQSAMQALAHPSPAQRPGTYANGLAWAADRAFIDEFRFFDACIIGGGDRAISCAAYGSFDHIFEWHRMNHSQQAYYLKWAVPFFSVVRSRVTSLEGVIYHQWHGKAADRGLPSRHLGLQPFGFDPAEDIAIDSDGCWRWNSEKPDMHKYIENYFSSRREDG
jgi:hypothetical protein